MIRELLERLPNPRRLLQDRISVLVAIGVAFAVGMASVAAYVTSAVALYARTDDELVEIAAVTRTWVQRDIEGMGGINNDALRAVNANVVLLRSDNQSTYVPGSPAPFTPGATELAIARTQVGSSARTVKGTDGARYRLVAVPLDVDGSYYALVIGRPLAPTEDILRSLQIAILVFGFTGIVLATGFGWWIGRSAVRPLRDLSQAVAVITETDDLEPITVRGDDEIADLTRAFNTMLLSLESSRERQKRLIADAGHELRTPLTSMRTNIELLMADDRSGMLPPGARSEILADVAAQLGEFTTLVGDLVQLSREDRVEAAPEPIDFQDVVARAVERAKRRGPSLTFDVSLEPLYLVGEPDSLERAVTNLLDNAVKFSPDGGTVTVEMADGRLRIADQGPGIAEEDLPHVFDRFYRSDKARTTPGTGLGLSIVDHTVKAHGGAVAAGRAPEGGAEFVVSLPGRSAPWSSDEDTEETVVLRRDDL
ncbi:sensor histidine kinase [Propionicicella superfundia]|uniref:sensor histidine kinase n=1 Tax=Propionicicella superfundia TaxID=348582 RepID=UPI0004171812|nr:HAMP domain-containing sensor histidine kinase [Propionicicella superfundia]